MTEVLESAITKAILSALRAEGCFAEKLHGGPSQGRGLPDLWVIYGGMALGIEVKRPGRGKEHDPTILQQYILDKMAGAGAVTGCAHSVAEALALLELVKRKVHN